MCVCVNSKNSFSSASAVNQSVDLTATPPRVFRGATRKKHKVGDFEPMLVPDYPEGLTNRQSPETCHFLRSLLRRIELRTLDGCSGSTLWGEGVAAKAVMTSVQRTEPSDSRDFTFHPAGVELFPQAFLGCATGHFCFSAACWKTC